MPAKDHVDEGIVSESRNFGEIMLDEVIGTTKASSRGIIVRKDQVGFNWCKVPMALIEVGFMTNSEEDRFLATEEYRNLLINGMLKSINKYFGFK